jgi:hypothetical protein
LNLTFYPTEPIGQVGAAGATTVCARLQKATGTRAATYDGKGLLHAYCMTAD